MADKPITDAGVIEQIRAALPTATSVVAGLMLPEDKRDIFTMQGLRTYEVKNADYAVNNGTYRFNAGYDRDPECVPILGQKWGILLNFVAYPNLSILQIFMSSYNLVAFRQSYEGPITGAKWIKLIDADM